jgi:hypothetical protein
MVESLSANLESVSDVGEVEHRMLLEVLSQIEGHGFQGRTCLGRKQQ